jgi:hypothetical protein
VLLLVVHIGEQLVVCCVDGALVFRLCSCFRSSCASFNCDQVGWEVILQSLNFQLTLNYVLTSRIQRRRLFIASKKRSIEMVERFAWIFDDIRLQCCKS